jgi:glycosyltransferase involved in cell wall biosynthesis
MARRLAIFHPPGRLGLAHNPFGKDVANLQLFQALARHGGLERLDVLSLRPTTPDELSADLLGEGIGGVEVATGSILEAGRAIAAGALLRGQPYLSDLAWLRRRAGGDRAFSLLGLVHTLAPPYVREAIASALSAPLHPWDAVICTSPAVRDGLQRVFEAWGEHLAERTSGRPPPAPRLPVVPLGVDAAAFAPDAGRRARGRAALGLTGDEPLILWVGRLSFFEKAFPQPMFAVVQAAGRLAGVRPTFVMAGWFPNPGDRQAYEDAARAWAPDVRVVFVDGNDRARTPELWAAADIFLSLVDNIQETFGITPLEAMASGLPVVASDWDGYRATVRDGVEGFLIPTLIGPAGGRLGESVVLSHVLEINSYQSYVGAVAQHTAVHISRAAEALARLIREPDLRRRMGEAGRARVREAFDWPVVARAYMRLVDELSEIRAAAPDPPMRFRMHPAKGDPFGDFAPFATHALTPDTPLVVAPGLTAPDVLAAAQEGLSAAFAGLRASPELCAEAFEQLAGGKARTVREVLLAFPAEERRRLEMALAWMAKYGFVDWLT